MTDTNNKKNIPLIVIAIILLLAVITLSVLNRRKKDSPSPSSSTDQSSTTPPDRLDGELSCLPPNKAPCTYVLLFEENYYHLEGLSQALLIDTGFNLGDKVTVLGQISF